MSSRTREPGKPSTTRLAPIEDVLRDGLEVLFVGANPDPVSAHRGHHFSHPSNAFWRLLHESGFTDRKLDPDEERHLLDRGIGVVNLSQRMSSGISGLTKEDIERGRSALARKLARHRPKAIVFVGICTYRMFTGAKGPVFCGEQPERLFGARVFVVPHPSGRNAHYRRDVMLEHWKTIAHALGFPRRHPGARASP